MGVEGHLRTQLIVLPLFRHLRTQLISFPLFRSKFLIARTVWNSALSKAKVTALRGFHLVIQGCSCRFRQLVVVIHFVIMEFLSTRSFLFRDCYKGPLMIGIHRP